MIRTNTLLRRGALIPIFVMLMAGALFGVTLLPAFRVSEKPAVPASNSQALYVIQDESTSVYLPGRINPTRIPIRYVSHATFDATGRLITWSLLGEIRVYERRTLEPIESYPIEAIELTPDQKGGVFFTDGADLIHIDSKMRVAETMHFRQAVSAAKIDLATFQNGNLLVARGSEIREYPRIGASPRRTIHLKGSIHSTSWLEQPLITSAEGAIALKTTEGVEIIDPGLASSYLLPDKDATNIAFDHRGNCYVSHIGSENVNSSIAVYAAGTWKLVRTIQLPTSGADEMAFDDADDLYVAIERGKFWPPPALNVYGRDSDRLLYTTTIDARHVGFGPLPQFQRVHGSLPKTTLTSSRRLYTLTAEGTLSEFDTKTLTRLRTLNGVAAVSGNPRSGGVAVARNDTIDSILPNGTERVLAKISGVTSFSVTHRGIYAAVPGPSDVQHFSVAYIPARSLEPVRFTPLHTSLQGRPLALGPGDTVYVGSSSEVDVYNPDLSMLLWRAEVKGYIHYFVVLRNGDIVAATMRDLVYIKHGGKEIYRRPILSEPIWGLHKDGVDNIYIDTSYCVLEVYTPDLKRRLTRLNSLGCIRTFNVDRSGVIYGSLIPAGGAHGITITIELANKPTPSPTPNLVTLSSDGSRRYLTLGSRATEIEFANQ